jgi:ribosomal protein S1
MIINVDRKNRSINLSIKAKDQAEQRSDEQARIRQRGGQRYDQPRCAAEGQAERTEAVMA